MYRWLRWKGSLPLPHWFASTYIYGDPGLYRRIFRAHDLVFDIGAGTGKMSEWYLHRGARVVAVEPEQVDYEALCANLGDNSRATPLRIALGESPGVQKLAIYPGASTISTFVPHIQWSLDGAFKGTRPMRYEEVEVTTLDALIGEFGWPQFVKIDVEGYEAWVLRGLSQPVPFVQFEFSGWVFKAGQTQECIARILEIAPRAVFNYTVDESPAFEMRPSWEDRWWAWYTADEVLTELRRQIAISPWYWGNVFADMRKDCDRRKLARRRGIRKRRHRASKGLFRGARL
jgi:FkbM family methyltransferase